MQQSRSVLIGVHSFHLSQDRPFRHLKNESPGLGFRSFFFPVSGTFFWRLRAFSLPIVWVAHLYWPRSIVQMIYWITTTVSTVGLLVRQTASLSSCAAFYKVLLLLFFFFNNCFDGRLRRFFPYHLACQDGVWLRELVPVNSKDSNEGREIIHIHPRTTQLVCRD